MDNWGNLINRLYYEANPLTGYYSPLFNQKAEALASRFNAPVNELQLVYKNNLDNVVRLNGQPMIHPAEYNKVGKFKVNIPNPKLGRTVVNNKGKALENYLVNKNDIKYIKNIGSRITNRIPTETLGMMYNKAKPIINIGNKVLSRGAGIYSMLDMLGLNSPAY